MKNLHIACLCLFTLIACSSETSSNNEPTDKTPIQGSAQVWKLVAMSENIVGIDPATGSNMEWQEKYVLLEDGTFSKSRIINNRTLEENGTYSFVNLDDGQYLELTYLSQNTLIANCTSDTKEFLKVEENNKLVSTWWACDGPGLFYNRVQ